MTGNFLEIIENPITFAFSMATIFYLSTQFIGKHFSSDKKENFSLWLLGAYESTWSQHFCMFFDTIFGKNWFSFRRFITSAIVSILAVLLCYFSLSKIGVYEQRIIQELSVIDILLIALVINVIADYISLNETRYLLSLFKRGHGAWHQVLGLIFDVIISAIIIFIAITLFRIINDERLISFSELIATFSDYSVFFYSTFFTSVWAWIYCLSFWFMKLFCKSPLSNWLDVEEKPFNQIALIGSIFVFIGTLGVANFIKPIGETGMSKFDDFLCTNVSAKICEHTARMTDNEQEKLSRLERACKGGTAKNCYDISIAIFEQSHSIAFNLIEGNCNRGDASSCGFVGRMYEHGAGTKKNLTKAFEGYEKACFAGIYFACTPAIVLHARHGVGKEIDSKILQEAREKFEKGMEHNIGIKFGTVDYIEQLQLYEVLCENDSMYGCHSAGFYYSQGFGTKIDQGKAIELYEKACVGEEMASCSNAGYMYERGEGTHVDLELALVRYEQACEREHVIACDRAGIMYEKGKGTKVNFPLALARYEKACEIGHMKSCYNEGNMYDKGKGVRVNMPFAMNLYQKACKGNVDEACSAIQKQKN